MNKKMVIALLLILTLLPYKEIHADHNKPGTLIPCDNTYYYYAEYSYTQYRTETHGVTMNGMCTITHYLYSHHKKCSSCHQILVSNVQMWCTHIHTQNCGNTKDCTLVLSD